MSEHAPAPRLEGMMKIASSNILSALSPSAIGTRVTDPERFMAVLQTAVAEHDFSTDRVPGQGFILLPDAIPCVSAGVGARTQDPDDYVVRLHRGCVGTYLRRGKAAPVEGCAAIVYTVEAYLSDPDVLGDAEEVARVTGATHVLVAVLAFAGPKPPLTPHRFVSNLAGGNREAQVWTADEIRALAKDIQAYDDAWAVVAD